MATQLNFNNTTPAAPYRLLSDDRWLFLLLMFVLALLQFLDGYSTYACLVTGIGKEANPVVVWVASWMGLVWGMVAFKLLDTIILAAIALWSRRPNIVLLIPIALYLSIVAHNLLLLRYALR